MSNGSGSQTPLLIDTHYWIWLQFGIREQLTAHSLELVRKAVTQGQLLLSIFSIWELGMLESKGLVHLHTSCAQWVEDALAMPGLSLAPLTPAIALESSRLPGSFHGDAADRIIVATARVLGARLLTSDQNICAYGRQRHVLLA